MKEQFKRETNGLVMSWGRHDQEVLRSYLVQDVEDPRINIQSILTRHFLLGHLFGERFSDLKEQELRFGLIVNWLLKLFKASVDARRLHTILDALLEGEDNIEGLKIPGYVIETFAGLALPNYICDLLNRSPAETTDVPIPRYLMETFQKIWRESLEDEQPKRISALEPACGSANDYRFIDAYGIGRLLEYTGIDLCEKNICNAKQMFPSIRFEVGNMLEIEAPTNAFDYCFIHDLFEHLSVEAMEAAISEVCRVTRQEICVGFFNMHDGKQHIVRAVDNYHWNELSMTRTKTVFERRASDVKVIHIDTFLKSKFSFSDTHNKGAYMFVIRM
jgi:ubiquinone/menaquinone biosynthesis C-methylase UbiE